MERRSGRFWSLGLLLLLAALAAACSTATTTQPASPEPTLVAPTPPTQSPAPQPAAATPTPSGPTATPQPQAPATSAAPSDLTIATVRLTNGQGQEFALTVEVPQTREAMARGLMGRSSLPEDSGMLFLFGDRRSGFWMKDTLIPLSVAFISKEGVIQDIQEMQPLTLDIHNTEKPYSYGLEVNQGWFARRGIKAGDRVRFPWPYEAPPKSPWE